MTTTRTDAWMTDGQLLGRFVRARPRAPTPG